jgi:hypothetical protein
MLVDAREFYIDRDNIEYRGPDGDSGETDGGHWCGRHAQAPHSNWTYFNIHCAFVPPNLTEFTTPAGPLRDQAAQARKPRL